MTSLTTTTSLTYTDSPLSSGTQYFYKVSASNSGSATTVSNEQSVTTQATAPAPGQPTSGTPIYQINAGSGTVAGSFVGDEFASGGSTSAVTSKITVAASDSASQAVYQSNRYGTFSYAFPQLAANGTYTLVLHFAETYAGDAAVGKRVFTVAANGNAITCPVAGGGSTNCFNNVDIYARAGFNTALVISAPVTADANGKRGVPQGIRTCRDRKSASGTRDAGAESATRPAGQPGRATRLSPACRAACQHRNSATGPDRLLYRGGI